MNKEISKEHQFNLLLNFQASIIISGHIKALLLDISSLLFYFSLVESLNFLQLKILLFHSIEEFHFYSPDLLLLGQHFEMLLSLFIKLHIVFCIIIIVVSYNFNLVSYQISMYQGIISREFHPGLCLSLVLSTENKQHYFIQVHDLFLIFILITICYYLQASQSLCLNIFLLLRTCLILKFSTFLHEAFLKRVSTKNRRTALR